MSVLPSGLDAQLGLATETAYGTFAPPTRFLEFVSESIRPEITPIYSRGLGRGRTQRASQTRTHHGRAGGELQFEVMTHGFGLLFRHMLGAVTTTGAAAPFTHTFTPSADGLRGLSFSAQVGAPDIGATLRPLNFHGGKIASWTLECAVGDPLTLAVTTSFQGAQTATAAAAKSYAALAAPLIFVDGAATIAGDAVQIRGFRVEVDNGLDLERNALGNPRLEPLPSGELAVTGDLEFEFESLARTGELMAGTQLNNLQLTFIHGPSTLRVTVPRFLYVSGEGFPAVGGPDIITQSMPWKALDTGTDPLIRLEYINSEPAP